MSLPSSSAQASEAPLSSVLFPVSVTTATTSETFRSESVLSSGSLKQKTTHHQTSSSSSSSSAFASRLFGSSLLDPFASSNPDLTSGQSAPIDRSQSLLSESLFKSDRLRRKKNLKKTPSSACKGSKRNSLDGRTLFGSSCSQTPLVPTHANAPPSVNASGQVRTVTPTLMTVHPSFLPHPTPSSAGGVNNGAIANGNSNARTQAAMDTATAAMAATVASAPLEAHYHHSNDTNPSAAPGVKRNVIIQRDSRGYGIRISGDNPVSIESVHPDGAAFKAGVRNGDRILKVNGTLVTKLSHADVVRMIQNCGSYVGLTLFSPTSQPSGAPIELPMGGAQTPAQANSPTPPSTHLGPPHLPNSGATSPSLLSGIPSLVSNVQITSPQQAPESTIQAYQNNGIKTLRLMIEHEENHLKSELPNLSVKERTEKTRIIEEMKRKLAALMTTNSAPIPGATDGPDAKQTANPGSKTLGVRSTICTVDSDYEESFPGPPTGTGIPTISDLSDGFLEMEDGLGGLNGSSGMGGHSKSPPSKSTSFLSKIPGASKSGKRDSKGFTLSSGLLSAGGMLSSPAMSSLGISGQLSPPAATGGTPPGSGPVTMETLHLHSLRFARYLIMQSLPPHGMLFYVVTKHIFPALVANATSIVVNHNRTAASLGLAETGGLARLINRWANQIMSTWICKETPLFFTEFPPDSLEAFDQKLGTFISTVSGVSSTGVAANPFESPFMERSAEIVTKQLAEFQAAVAAKPEMLATPAKADLQATIEYLFHAPTGIGSSGGPKLDLSQVDSTFDQYIASVTAAPTNQLTMIPTMAVVASLLTIGHYVFGISSKHLLLSDVASCTSLLLSGSLSGAGLVTGTPPIAPSPVASNPVLKLSSESSSSTNKAKHKRFPSLPSQPKPSLNGSSSGGVSGSDLLSLGAVGAQGAAGTGISESGHYFVQVADLTKVAYCSGCLHTLWGDLYSYHCPKCLLSVHLWCLKTTAQSSPCPNAGVDLLAPSGVQLRNSASAREPSRKKSKLMQSKKTSIIDRLAGKAYPKSSATTSLINSTSSALNRSNSSLTSSSSSSFQDTISDSSSDFEEEHSSGVASGAHDEVAPGSTVTSPVGGFSGSMVAALGGPRAPLPNRSGSFNQRKKTKGSIHGSTPRKRSDPALTSGHMSTITGATSGSIDSPTPPTLTSAQSSGALLGYSTSMAQGGDPSTTSGSTLQHQTSVPSGPGGAFRPLNKGQAAKKMTASDSSLMCGTNSSLSTAAGTFANQSSINLSAGACAMATGSPRHSRRERKDRQKTADSAIVCNTSDSETDETAPLTGSGVRSPAEQLYGYDNESIQVTNIDETGSPYRSVDSGLPPPLPPRPVSEKRRQIKAEIVETEWHHYETLRYIRNVYQRPFRKEKIFTPEQMDAIFGNTKALKGTHKKIYKEMRAAHSSDSDLFDTGNLERALMEIFDGPIGRDLETQAADFVKNQKMGHGMMYYNQKRKDSRLKALFDSELKQSSMPDCRLHRLTLPELLGSVFQRPLRYSLLLDRLLDATPKDTAAYKNLEIAASRSKEIGKAINEETARAELDARLKEIIKTTDCAMYGARELLGTLTNEVLVKEGILQLRTGHKAKPLDVNLILTRTMLLMLIKEGENKYALKKVINPQNKKPFKLDIRMDDVLTRDGAMDPVAFFIISRSQEILYEFAAPTSNDCKSWRDTITNIVNEYREMHPNLVNATVAKSSSRLTDLSAQPREAANQTAVSPPAALLNRPLPKPPTESPTQVVAPPPEVPPPPPPPAQATETPPPPPPPPPASKPIAGTIQRVVEHEDLVSFNQVKVVANESMLHYASEVPFQRSASQERDLNDKWRRVGAYVNGLKEEVSELLVCCDFEQHTDSAEIIALKHRMVADLVELAIKIDHNNRPTLEPFDPLVRKVTTYLSTLNSENIDTATSPTNPFESVDAEEVVDVQESPLEAGDDGEERKSARSGSEQEQILEDLAHLQINELINEFKDKATKSGSSSSSSTTTVVETSSRVVTSATSLITASSSTSHNPFDLSVAEVAGNSLSTNGQPVDAQFDALATNAFPSTSTTNTTSSCAMTTFDLATATVSRSLVTSSTTVISTEVYEGGAGHGQGHVTATPFDQLIDGVTPAGELIGASPVALTSEEAALEEGEEDGDEQNPPLPLIPPPYDVAIGPSYSNEDQSALPARSQDPVSETTTQNQQTSQPQAPPPSAHPKSEMFTL